MPTVVCSLLGSRAGNWQNKNETKPLEEGPNTPSAGNSSYGGYCCHVISCSPCTYVPSTHPIKSVTGDPLCAVDAAYLSSLRWRIQWNACKVLSKGGGIYDIVYQCLPVVQVWSNPVILLPHFSKMKMFMPKYTYSKLLQLLLFCLFLSLALLTNNWYLNNLILHCNIFCNVTVVPGSET